MSTGTPHPIPSEEEQDDALLAVRYGDLADVEHFAKHFGAPALAALRDPNQNTILHMACANGHTDLLDFLLPRVPPDLLAAQNSSGSTALHWAALNSQLGAAQRLVEFKGGPGAALIDIKNAAGRSPLGEAENAGWEDGARWMVGAMRLDETSRDGEPGADEPVPEEAVGDIEVEIEDADGQIARMSLASSGQPKPAPPSNETKGA